MSRSFFTRAKDAALETAVLAFLRPKAQRYGEILNLSIYSQAKLLNAEILLHGEEKPIVISRALYRLEREETRNSLVFYEVKISRDWMQNIFEDHFGELRVKVPDVVVKLLT